MYKKVTLPNGIVVVMEEIPFVRSVSFGVWVKNGSRNENETTNGISHFIEHMLFKGTENRTAKQIADEMDAVGGQINAYTTKEYTCYYTRTLDSHFDTALDLVADMILNSKFDEADINKERNVIMEEINMYEDSPEELVHDLLEQSVFGGSSLGFNILGGRESIAGLNKAVFRDYYQKQYHPSNMVIAVAGNIQADSAIAKIKSAFGGLSRPGSYEKPAYDACYKPVFVFKEKDIEQVHVTLGFPSIKTGTDEAYPLSILNTIFGGGMSSRLFQTIREEHGLSYAIYSHNTSFLDCGLFHIYAALGPGQVEQVVTLMLAEIKRLFTDRITALQLDKAKEQLKSNYLMSLESSSSRMSGIGRSQLLLERLLTPDELIEKIDMVNLDRLYGITEKIFDKKNIGAAAVGCLDQNTLDRFKAALQAV